jgi:hypothetical protein
LPDGIILYIPKIGYFLEGLEQKILVYFWNILQPFGMFYGHLVFFSCFGVLYREKSGSHGYLLSFIQKISPYPLRDFKCWSVDGDSFDGAIFGVKNGKTLKPETATYGSFGLVRLIPCGVTHGRPPLAPI